MVVFTCKDNFEDIMTCIFDAWSFALKNGHENLQLKKEPVYQQTFFDEYVHIDKDTDKVIKVVRSIKNQISYEAYLDVYYASLSVEEDALMAIYNYLRVGFAVGSSVTSMFTNPHVMRIKEIRRRVTNEGHHFKEFARFNSIDNRVYVCHVEPKNDVIWLMGYHFADRMPSEHWIIIDDNRRTAVVHPKDEENYLRYLSDNEWDNLKGTETYEDDFTGLWKSFFTAISIKERENRKCQRNLFPIWMRKHAVEFDT